MSPPPPMRMLLFGATLQATNCGVGALAAGAIRCLLAQHPDAQVEILDYGTDATPRRVVIDGVEIAVPVLNMRFSKRLFLPNNIPVLLLLAALARLLPFMRRWLIARNSTLQQIASADVIGAISGGDSFSDIYGLERLFYVSLPQILAIVLKKRLILLPQTYGPFYSRLARGVARFIVRHAEKVYSRDYRGLEDLRKLVGRDYKPEKYAFNFDVGFALQPQQPRNIEVSGARIDFGSTPIVGVNVSGLLWIGGYKGDNSFGLRCDYRQFITGLVETLARDRKATVLLVPHVFGRGPGSESDALACEEAFAALQARCEGRLAMLRGDFDAGEIKSIIGNCEFFVGARMHACIAAISQAVPTVAVAYSDKFIGVMDTVGVPSIVADARTLDTSQMIAFVLARYAERADLRPLLATQMQTVRTSVLGLFGGAGATGAERLPAANASEASASVLSRS